MVTSFPACVAVGAVLGFLSGLGVGGGSLLILWMTSVAALPYHQAKAINLLFFLPTALIATIHHLHSGTLAYKKTLPGVIAGSVFAGLFYYFSRSWNLEFLQKCFGGFLILIGFRELFWSKKS